MYFIKSKHGFTLIELLVVIAIIGLLATLAVVSFSNAREKARDTKRIADLRQISKAIELYNLDNGQYPQPSQGWAQWSGECPNYGGANEYILGIIPAYMGVLPLDPRWQNTNSRCYRYISNGTDYMLLAYQTMETVCGGDPSDACNPAHIQALDRPAYTEPTIAVYSSGATTW